MKRFFMKVFPTVAVVAGVVLVLALSHESWGSSAVSHVHQDHASHVEHAEHAEHEEHAQHAEHAEHDEHSHNHDHDYDFSGTCGDDNMDTRVAALNSLISMDTDQAMPILLQVLERRDECSVELRRKAVFLVSQHETENTVDILLDVVHNDPDFEVKHQGVFWMGQLSSDEAVVALESILRGTNDTELQEKVIFSLSQHGSSRATSILREFAGNNSEHSEAREDAIFWLGQEGSTADVEFLMDLYPNLNSDELRNKVVFSVSQSSHSGSGEWLIGIASDESLSAESRKDALFWAGQEGNVDATAVRDIYENANNREFQEHAIFVLSQLDNADATEQLIDIAKSEDNSELRDKALFWLGESRDPRAAQFIRDLINR